jgi:hypothetical protein
MCVCACVQKNVCACVANGVVIKVRVTLAANAATLVRAKVQILIQMDVTETVKCIR